MIRRVGILRQYQVKARPGIGKTHQFSIAILKNNKPQRKRLQMAIYGLDEGIYQLTIYIL